MTLTHYLCSVRLVAVVEATVSRLERCRSLDEVQRLHEAGDHSAVVDLLLATLRHPGHVLPETLERHQQLLLLQDSLWQLAHVSRCLLWSEVALSEAYQCYRGAASSLVRQDWAATVTSLMQGILR